MIITDVIELEKIKPHKDTQKLVKFRDEFNQARVFMEDLVGQRSPEMETVADKAHNHFFQQRLRLFEETGTLGDELEKNLDGSSGLLTKLSASPKTNLKSIRQLADALGFVIIPFAYMSKEAYKDEEPEMRKQILNFGALAESFNVYALCPVIYYSLNEHLHANDADLPIYPGRHQQTFLSIQMSVPVFRTVLADLSDLKDQVKNLDKRMESTEKNVESLTRMIRELQKTVERDQRAAVLQRTTNAEGRARLESLEASVFAQKEPLMFAVNKDIILVSDDTWAVVGPCWGPDFEDLVFTALGYNQKKGQRKMIAKVVAENWMSK